MTEDEKNRIAGQAIRRIGELLEEAARREPLENGKPLPPDIAAEIDLVRSQAQKAIGPLSPESQAEVELILAELRVLGRLPESSPVCPRDDPGCTYGSGSCDCAR